jgi:hypothetical protein
VNTLIQLVGQTDLTTTNDTAASAGFLAGFGFLSLALLVLTLIGYWKVFTKIGLPGWMGIVPFVNIYMLFKARGQREPIVWLILCLIPCIQIIGLWFLANDTAELFGKGLGWKIFLFIFPGLSHLILGFGGSQADRSMVAPGVGLNA